jgi:hypothetical protein
MSPSRLFATALSAILLTASGAGAGYDIRMSSVRAGFYLIYDVGVLLDMPDCMRPCAKCSAFFDTDAQTVIFAERACAVAGAYRAIEPTPGRTDIVLSPRGRDLYVSAGRDWLFETDGCAVTGAEIATRVVIDGRRNRLLMEAADHPDASVTGRVTCSLTSAYVKLAP